MAIEDLVAYSTHLVLCCREGGLPVLRTVAWAEFGIAPSASKLAGAPVDTADQVIDKEADESQQGSADEGNVETQKQTLPLRPLRQDQVPELPLPAWAMHVVSGANLSFDAEVHVCHASSPAHPEQELRFHLATAELLPPKPVSTEAMEAVQGVKARRLHVRPSYASE
ncbi:MAG: hypothetical protein HC767_01850 [Akkermansiaceae bacterium]|nr:hypothetical protein [Akkermansiaceae bacterium]